MKTKTIATLLVLLMALFFVSGCAEEVDEFEDCAYKTRVNGWDEFSCKRNCQELYPNNTVKIDVDYQINTPQYADQGVAQVLECSCYICGVMSQEDLDLMIVATNISEAAIPSISAVTEFYEGNISLGEANQIFALSESQLKEISPPKELKKLYVYADDIIFFGKECVVAQNIDDWDCKAAVSATIDFVDEQQELNNKYGWIENEK